MAGFINIAIVAACSARCLSPSTKETEKCQTLLLIFFITTTVAPYLSSKWLRYSFHHYYGTQDRFGQISPSLSTTTGMCGLPKMGAKKTPRTFKKSVALQLGRYSIFISIMWGERQHFSLSLPWLPISGNRQGCQRRRIYAPFILTVDCSGWFRYLLWDYSYIQIFCAD